MGRAFIFFVIIYAFLAALMFGWRFITRSDVKLTGKLVVVGIITFVFTMAIYIIETGGTTL